MYSSKHELKGPSSIVTFSFLVINSPAHPIGLVGYKVRVGIPFRVVVSLLPLLGALFFGGFLHGQTAAEMDALLDTREITWAQACRFVLPAARALEAGNRAAFALALERGWLPKGAAADRSVTLGGLSFLISNAFSIKNSVLYALFPGPRYAYRQLDYLGLIPGLRDPAMKVSGERLVQILGRVLDYRGDEEPEIPQELPPTAPKPETPPAVPAENRVQEQREQMVRDISVELETRNVADTTVRVVDEGVAISLNNIQFLPDETELTERERIKLMRVAVILDRYPGRKILVGGHTAMAGTAEGRLAVSAQRAQAVADFLVFLESRRPEEIIVRGYGAEQPLGDHGTPAGQALNRRVEITILDE
jgi:outer membrane protein OmpA-like peptidoglycan-associated protein